jgi:uncharacterized circularly permuted ATP-grasp superfamily protein/uncharacterized alpha-E superfamily protein
MSNSSFFQTPFDELHDPSGNIRAHWVKYFEHLAQLGTEQARRNWSKTKQLLHENGASYNVYRDASPGERPWRLSPIPYVVSSEDWQILASGIAQRARFLSALLTDLYGPQRTLVDGDLPAELIFANPRFLRSVHGLAQKRNNWLPLYGVDLIRAPNGQFYALEDATQAPSGMGYALENRIVIAQTQSDVMRKCSVERLASFFRLFRERLAESAPHNRDSPRLALWTPGPFSATYFEQVYLAKYLSLTLVQGEDLTVRDDRVYLKTLGGLQQIDVLLRRVFDDFADPLELRPDSALGIPGFVQSIRAGNVGLFNPIGTGLLETPAFLAFFPKLCRKLLHEDLRLPSVPTYYCGDPTHLDIVLSDFESMVIKPTFPNGRIETTFVHQLDTAERDRLREEVRKKPELFVGQKFVPTSRTPVFSEGQISSRACVLRCFAHSSHPNDYQLLPGGLGLVAASDADLAVSLNRGARSKDVWVLSNEAILEDLIVPLANPPIAISRSGGDLPSRIADNLYWLGRYAERAEAVCRLARVLGTRLLDSSLGSSMRTAMTLTRLRTALLSQIRFVSPQTLRLPLSMSPTDCERDLLEAVTESSSSGSVISSLKSTLRVSRIVRDRLSHDTWRILSSLDESVTRIESLRNPEQLSLLLAELNHIVITLAGFSGLAQESMTRGYAFRFLDMGRRLERALSMVTLLRATITEVTTEESSLVEAVLEVADSGMTYRRRYPASLQIAPAVDLLLSDDTNPRSILFQLRALTEHMKSLPVITPGQVRSMQHRLLLSATSQIELSDAEELCRADPNTHNPELLHNLLDQLGRTFPSLSDSLSETYLYHASIARHLKHGTTDTTPFYSWEARR